MKAYAVQDRDGIARPGPSKKAAQRDRRENGGLVVVSSEGGPWRPYKRRVFLWVFLAIQVVFIVWLIAGAASRGPDTGIQVAQLCDNHAWYPLYSSQADCVKNSGSLLAGASDTGRAIGAGLIVVVWVVVDFLVGLTYGIYRLATRRS